VLVFPSLGISYALVKGVIINLAIQKKNFEENLPICMPSIDYNVWVVVSKLLLIELMMQKLLFLICCTIWSRRLCFRRSLDGEYLKERKVQIVG
jgi:hypothetical protein